MNNIFNQIRARCLSVNWRDTPIYTRFALENTSTICIQRCAAAAAVVAENVTTTSAKTTKTSFARRRRESPFSLRNEWHAYVFKDACRACLYCILRNFFFSLYFPNLIPVCSTRSFACSVVESWLMNSYAEHIGWEIERRRRNADTTHTNNFCVLNISWSWYYR